VEVKMLQPRYTQNSFSIAFPRYPNIRRRANDFEDFLKKRFQGHYGQPQVIPVPDELDPEVPRLIFGSRHGFSQIIVSQIGMTLNATYSPDWQIEIAKGREYLKSRGKALFELLSMLENIPAYFSGLTTRVRLATESNENGLLRQMRNRLDISLPGEDIHEINVKITTVEEDKFFNNITIQNFRTWKNIQSPDSIPRLSRKNSSERGLEIIVDFNDRYAFNERPDYFSSDDVALEVIDKGLQRAGETSKLIGDAIQ
jgi:hypothetical protein